MPVNRAHIIVFFCFLSLLILPSEILAQTKTADSIQYALLGKSGDDYYTVAGNHQQVKRWQNYTGRLLTTYQVPPGLLKIYLDPERKALVGVGSNGICVMDKYSGKVINTLQYPETAGQINIFSIGEISDFDPHSNRMLLFFEGKALVMDLNTGKEVARKEISSSTYSPVLLKNGKVMIARDQITQEIYAWNFDTGKRTVLKTNSLIPSIGKNENGDKFFIKSGEVTIYNAQLQPEFTNNKEIQLPGNDAMLGNLDLVLSSGMGPQNYVRITGNDLFWQARSPITHYGCSVAGGKILFWNAKEIFIEDFISQRVFQHTSYLASMQRPLPAGLAYAPADSVLMYTASNGPIALVHNRPVTAIAQGKILITGDAGGNLYFWTADGKLSSKQAMLGDAITYLSLNDNVLLVGSSGRAVFKNLTDASLNTLRGFNGSVISSYADQRRQLILTGTSAGEVLVWDAKNYSLIHKYTSRAIPLNLAMDAMSNIIAGNENASDTINAAPVLKDYFAPPQRLIFNAGHLTGIDNVRFSADGKQLLSSDNSGTAKLWDIHNLVTLKTYYHDEHAKNAVFSKDERSIIMHNQNSLFLFNRYSGQLISTANIPAAYQDVKMLDIEVHPNNLTVMLTNNNSRSTLQYNLNMGKFFYYNTSRHQYSPFGTAISPDGKQVATLGNNVLISNFESGAFIREIPHPNNFNRNKYVNRLIKYSPDGKLLLLQTDSGFIVYNLETNLEQLRVDGSNLALFTGNDQLVYYTSYAELIGINLTTKQEFFKIDLNKQGKKITSMDYSPVNHLLATGNNAGEIELLNALNGKSIKNSKLQTKRTSGVLHPVTGAMAMALPGAIKIFDWQSVREEKTIATRGTIVSSLTYAPDGKLLAASNWNTQLYSTDNYAIKHEIAHSGNLKFSPDSRYLAIQDLDSLFVYDLLPAKPALVMDIKYGFGGFEMLPESKELMMLSIRVKPGMEKAPPSLLNNQYFLEGYQLETGKKLSEVQLNLFNPGDFNITSDGAYTFFQTYSGEVTVIDNREKKTKTIKHFGDIDGMSVTKDNKYLLVYTNEGDLYAYDIASGKLKAEMKGHTGFIKNISFWENFMFTAAADGSGIVWDSRNFEKILQVNLFANGEYVFLNKDNYYTGTAGIASGVFFEEKNRIYPFEQFDLFYNRPDLVAKSINPGNSVLINAYHEAFLKRILKMGLDPASLTAERELPVVTVTRTNKAVETKDAALSFSLNAADPSNTLEKLNIWVNDVPVFGSNGLSVKNRKVKSLTQSFTVTLGAGFNKIQVSCLNSRGVESLKETFEVTYNPAEEKKPDLYVIAVSVSDYLENTYDLKYARKDGSDLVKLLGSKTANYNQVFIDTLFDKDATKEKFMALKAKLKQTHVDDKVVLFISGHGLLDKDFNFYYATHDINFKDPSKRGLSYNQIEYLLDSIPARKKILLMDACHSGEIDKNSLVASKITLAAGVSGNLSARKKGIEVEASSGLNLSNSFLLMQNLFANLSRGSGAVVISAAAGDSYALESDKWKNGIFTFSLLDGLKNGKADANKDREIKVNELRDYVYKSVEEATGGLQKPTARQQNLAADFRIW